MGKNTNHKLRRWLQVGSFAAICIVNGPVCAAVILALPGTEQNPLRPSELTVTEKGIRLSVEARPLAEVLQGIQAVSGIRVEVATDVMKTPTTTSVQGAHWQQVLEHLLAEYNWMQISNERQLVIRVIIGGRRGAAALPPITGKNVRRFGDPPSEPPAVRGAPAEFGVNPIDEIPVSSELTAEELRGPLPGSGPPSESDAGAAPPMDGPPPGGVLRDFQTPQGQASRDVPEPRN